MTEAEVVLVEDDAMVREWVIAALAQAGYRLAAVAGTAQEALEVVRRRRAALLLIDHRLPNGSGTELVRTFRGLGVSIPAVVMTAAPTLGLNEAARAAGAQGTVLKTGRIDELLATIGRVLEGQVSFDPRHPERSPRSPRLSPREREVLRLVAGGATNREAAAVLGIGEQTVKTLMARIYDKLAVHRRSEAVAAAYEAGLL